MSVSELEPRLEMIRNALADIPEHEPWGNVLGEVGEAAVSLIVRPRASLEMLLIKRAVHEHDPWSGHMALPGGRMDAADESLLETAVRETREETAILLERARLLGTLPSVSPQSAPIPRMRISPFVFAVGPDEDAQVASHEVESLYWVSLETLMAPASRGTVTMPLLGSVREFPAIRVEGHDVWGLTYRVVRRFLDLMDSAIP